MSTRKTINPVSQVILDKQSVCKHFNYEHKYLNPGSNGIDDSKEFHAICQDCNKILAFRSECISATWMDVYDKEWGERTNNYSFQE